MLRRLLSWATWAGVDLVRLRETLKLISNHRRDAAAFWAGASCPAEFDARRVRPHLFDKDTAAGVASGHYFHQDLHVARAIKEANPTHHVDVGSRIDGFIAHLAVFRAVEVLDVRPVDAEVPNVTFRVRDIMQTDPRFDHYTESLSCLHALEHFGLGRYGDPLDFNGHRRGFANLTRMVVPSGLLYLSVPISRHQRVEFNAQRVFSMPYVLEDLIGDTFAVEQFAYVDDDGALHTGVDAFSVPAQNTFGLEYGCGIFTLRKT